jgi:hypothetical protein
MNITGIIPQQEVHYSTKETDMEKDISAFQDLHPDAEITDIDGREVIGMCENCDTPIFWDQPFEWDVDGII